MMMNKIIITISGYSSKRRKFTNIQFESIVPYYSNDRDLLFWVKKHRIGEILEFCSINDFMKDEIVSVRYIAESNDIDMKELLIELIELSEEDALAIFYAYKKMSKSLEGLDLEKKIEILFATLSIAYDAREVAFEEAKKIINQNTN